MTPLAKSIIFVICPCFLTFIAELYPTFFFNLTLVKNMLHISLVSLSVSLFSFFLLAGASSLGHGIPLVQRHHELAKRADGDIELFRRVSGARMTFYNVETGNA